MELFKINILTCYLCFIISPFLVGTEETTYTFIQRRLNFKIYIIIKIFMSKNAFNCCLKMLKVLELLSKDP